MTQHNRNDRGGVAQLKWGPDESRWRVISCAAFLVDRAESENQETDFSSC